MGATRQPDGGKKSAVSKPDAASLALPPVAVRPAISLRPPNLKITIANASHLH
jgi:hypothetical protein